MAIRIIYILAMIAFKLGDRKENRNHLIASLVYLATWRHSCLFFRIDPNSEALCAVETVFRRLDLEMDCLDTVHRGNRVSCAPSTGGVMKTTWGQTVGLRLMEWRNKDLTSR